MANKRIRFAFLLCFVVSICHGQVNTSQFSSPTDLNKTGWNKVLCMKNGNTMLVHLEIGKPILMKVFDSTHKEIASGKCISKTVDESRFKETLFRGFFEINSEAVLFLDQERMSKHGLIRLRFNIAGELTDEKLVAESPSITTPTDFTVINNKGDDNYAIVFCTDKPLFKKCDLHITYYSSKHEPTKDIPLEVDRKKYDNLSVIGAEAKPNGICVSICLNKYEMNGSPTSVGLGSADVYSHYFIGYYVPKDSSTAKKSQLIDLSTDISPYLTFYTYNPFAKAVNLLLFSYREILLRDGLDWLPSALIAHLFIRLDEGDLGFQYNWIKNKLASDYLHTDTDTTGSYKGIPVNTFTNENGLSTAILQSFSRFKDPDARSKGRFNSYLGNVCVTQYDDDGKEMWGAVLPVNQCFKSYSKYYELPNLCKKRQAMVIFDDLPEQVYYRQFFSVNTYCRNRNYFMVYNDDAKNFNNTIKNPGDTVYAFENTDACYYKINKKKEITKSYLFGAPGANEHVTSFIEGADFDEQRGIYATLVQYKKGDDISLRMAWSHLD